MEKEFVTYEIALKLKELSFDEDCFGLYVSDNYGGTIENPVLISVGGKWGNSIYTINYTDYSLSESEIIAPLWQQAIDFLREEYDIVIEINRQNYFDTYANSYAYQAVCKVYKNKKLDRSVVVRNIKNHNNILYFYNEAREQAILEALKLIKEK